MHRPLLLALAPAIAVTLASVALAAADDDACPTGKVRNEDTLGQCCWEGQAWSSLYGACVGLAECPAGLVPTDNGEDCAAAECQDGQIELEGACCWPGQRWMAADPDRRTPGRCVGAPTCPAGRAPAGADCVALPAMPAPQLLPYVPVGPDDAERIEPGPYTRGSPRREVGRFRNERAHGVVITRPFWMKKTEVTRAEWQRVIGHDPARFKGCGPDCPVERVSWYEALYWLNRLSEKEGLPACYTLEHCTGEPGGGCRLDPSALSCSGAFRCEVVRFTGLECPGYRLPTEAEWEYAARAGTESATPIGALTAPLANHDPILEPIAVYAGNSGVEYPDGADCASWPARKAFARTCGTQPVGQRAPNAWRLDDMLGNVAEWVWDGYGRYPRQSQADPVRHLGLERVVRGGSWADGVRSLRVALRGRMPPTGRNAMVGFRWARTIRDDVSPSALRAPAGTTPPIGRDPLMGPAPALAAPVGPAREGEPPPAPVSAPDLVLGPIRIGPEPPLTDAAAPGGPPPPSRPEAGASTPPPGAPITPEPPAAGASTDAPDAGLEPERPAGRRLEVRRAPSAKPRRSRGVQLEIVPLESSADDD